jgi:peptidoglycan/LPS O-acetylase OafA/YrhL
MRGILALIIMSGHALLVAALPYGQEYQSILAIQGCSSEIALILFSLLSGYFINDMVERDDFNFKIFWLSRIWRLCPLMIVVVLITLILEMIMGGSSQRPEIWTGGMDAFSFLLGLFGAKQFVSAAANWFVFCLFVYYLIWILTSKTIKYFPLLILINILVICLAASFRLHDRRIFYYLPWVVGAILNHYDLLGGILRRRSEIDKYSYSLYLVHGPVIVFVGFILNSLQLNILFLNYSTILILSSIVACIPLTLYVDIPLNKIRVNSF